MFQFKPSLLSFFVTNCTSIGFELKKSLGFNL